MGNKCTICICMYVMGTQRMYSMTFVDTFCNVFGIWICLLLLLIECDDDIVHLVKRYQGTGDYFSSHPTLAAFNLSRVAHVYKLYAALFSSLPCTFQTSFTINFIYICTCDMYIRIFIVYTWLEWCQIKGPVIC